MKEFDLKFDLFKNTWNSIQNSFDKVLWLLSSNLELRDVSFEIFH